MKKTVIMIAIAVLLLLLLFVPIPRGTYRDGGTKDYRALTYRIVVWNRLTDGLSGDENGVYHKTSVFWFPHNFKSIDELWEKESGGETKNDFTFTEDPPAQAKGLPAVNRFLRVLFTVPRFFRSMF